MVAKLTLFVVLLVVVVGAVLYAGFRYIDRQAQRRHERELARSERDYDLLMEYAEEDAARDRRDEPTDDDSPDDVASRDRDHEREES